MSTIHDIFFWVRARDTGMWRGRFALLSRHLPFCITGAMIVYMSGRAKATTQKQKSIYRQLIIAEEAYIITPGHRSPSSNEQEQIVISGCTLLSATRMLYLTNE